MLIAVAGSDVARSRRNRALLSPTRRVSFGRLHIPACAPGLRPLVSDSAWSEWLHADGSVRPNDFDSAMKSPRLILGGGGAAVLGGVSVIHLYWAAWRATRQARLGPNVGWPGADRTLDAGDGFRRRGTGVGLRALCGCDGAMGAALGVPRLGQPARRR